MFEIEFYQLPNGTKPAEEFLDPLDTKMRAKALHSLSILEEFGNQLREPYSKQLEDGLFELRVYLKTPNAPGQRAFLRCAASFFLEIRQYSCGKMSCAT